jgi:putative endonuclease
VPGANQARGAAGEALVAEWYLQRGYRVLDRNWRNGRMGEIDLVVQHQPGTVVFCEVKTRSSAAYGHPWEAIGPDKLVRMRRLALAWMEQHGRGREQVRIDAAAVLGGTIEILHGL